METQDSYWVQHKANAAQKQFGNALIWVGNVLTVIGCLGVVLALSGLIEAELFAIGISSGIRVIGSVAIAGCLFSAIGYGIVEYFEN